MQCNILKLYHEVISTLNYLIFYITASPVFSCTYTIQRYYSSSFLASDSGSGIFTASFLSTQPRYPLPMLYTCVNSCNLHINLLYTVFLSLKTYVGTTKIKLNIFGMSHSQISTFYL